MEYPNLVAMRPCDGAETRFALWYVICREKSVSEGDSVNEKNESLSQKILFWMWTCSISLNWQGIETCENRFCQLLKMRTYSLQE